MVLQTAYSIGSWFDPLLERFGPVEAVLGLVGWVDRFLGRSGLVVGGPFASLGGAW